MENARLFFCLVAAACLTPTAALAQTGGPFGLIHPEDGLRVKEVYCRNVAEDGVRINHVISQSEVGDEIRLHGTCLTSETIILEGDRSYTGESRTGTIIRQSNGANLQALVASDSWAANSSTTGDPVRISHLTLDANSASNSGTNALVIRSWLTTVEDLAVENAGGDGIQITGTSQNGTALTNTQVNGRISNVFVNHSGANGIHVVDSGNKVTDWDLIDNWVANSGASGIQMDNAAGWKIRGNHVYGVATHAIFASRCYGTAIQDNYVEGFGSQGESGTSYYGIACTAQGNVASVISNNKVFMFPTPAAASLLRYIAIPQVNYGAGYIVVSGNAIYGHGGANETGTYYSVHNGVSLTITSSGNSVANVGTPQTVAGPNVTVTSGQ